MKTGREVLEVLSQAEWAERVARDLCTRLRTEPRLRLCLPTGDTPAPVYAALVAAVTRGEASLAEATVVLLDEYVGLAPADPARCDARLRRELIDRVEPRPLFHPIRVDDLAPDEAAAELDGVAAQGLDLALLGLGANGHVGMNEPGSTADSPTRLVRLARSTSETAAGRYGAGRAPTQGITLGLDRILDSREVWLLVTGEGKAEILARTLLGQEGPDCPASYLLRHPNLRVIADEPAASVARAAREAV